MNRQQTAMAVGGNLSMTGIVTRAACVLGRDTRTSAGSTKAIRGLWESIQSRLRARREAFRARRGRGHAPGLRLLQAAVLSVATICSVVNTRAQTLSSALTITLNSAKFNLEGYGKLSGYGAGPNLQNPVFSGLFQFQIRRFDDGSYRVHSAPHETHPSRPVSENWAQK